MTQTAPYLLNQILEKTIHIQAALKAKDVEVLLSAVEEKEVLISDFENLNADVNPAEVRSILLSIQEIDLENQVLTKRLMTDLEKDRMSNKRQLSQLEKGKHISNRYQNPYTFRGGSVLDQKK